MAGKESKIHSTTIMVSRRTSAFPLQNKMTARYVGQFFQHANRRLLDPLPECGDCSTVVTVHSNDHTKFSTLGLVLKPLLTKSETVAYSNQSDSSFYFSSAGYRKKEAIWLVIRGNGLTICQQASLYPLMIVEVLSTTNQITSFML